MRSHYVFTLLIALFSLTSYQPVQAYFEIKPSQAEIPEMNGISLQQYPNFATSWHLVTVRYRKDSNEMRFTYANDIAWKGLQSFNADYADGAVFAKIGLISESDPSFPSSIVPSGAKRYQFMVRDKKKYKDSDGWGYALFNGQGNLFNDDIKIKTEGCVACHRIVPERGFVFSRQLHLNPEKNELLLNSKSEKSKFILQVQQQSEVPDIIINKSRHQKKPIWQFVQGELQKHAFSGTLDEIVPLLIENSKANNSVSILKVDNMNWSAVIPAPKSDKCLTDSPFYILIQFNNKLVRDAEICI